MAPTARKSHSLNRTGARFFRMPVRPARKRSWKRVVGLLLARVVVYGGLLLAALIVVTLCLPMRGPFFRGTAERTIERLVAGLRCEVRDIEIDVSRGRMSVERITLRDPATGHHLRVASATFEFDPFALVRGDVVEAMQFISVRVGERFRTSLTGMGGFAPEERVRALAAAVVRGHTAGGGGGARATATRRPDFVLEVRDLGLSLTNLAPVFDRQLTGPRTDELELESVRWRPSTHHLTVRASAGDGARRSRGGRLRATAFETRRGWRFRGTGDRLLSRALLGLTSATRATFSGESTPSAEAAGGTRVRFTGLIEEVAVGWQEGEMGAAGAGALAIGDVLIAADATLARDAAVGNRVAIDIHSSVADVEIAATQRLAASGLYESQSSVRVNHLSRAVSVSLLRQLGWRDVAFGLEEGPIIVERTVESDPAREFAVASRRWTARTPPGGVLIRLLTPYGEEKSAAVRFDVGAAQFGPDAPVEVAMAMPMRLALEDAGPPIAVRLAAVDEGGSTTGWPRLALEARTRLTTETLALLTPPQYRAQLARWEVDVDADTTLTLRLGGGAPPAAEARASLRRAGFVLPGDRVAAPVSLLAGEFAATRDGIEATGVEVRVADLRATASASLAAGVGRVDADLAGDFGCLAATFPHVFDNMVIEGHAAGRASLTVGHALDPARSPASLAAQFRSLAAAVGEGAVTWGATAHVERGLYGHMTMPNFIRNITADARLAGTTIHLDNMRADAGRTPGVRGHGAIALRRVNFPVVSFAVHAPDLDLEDWVRSWYAVGTGSARRAAPDPGAPARTFELNLDVTADRWHADNPVGTGLMLRGAPFATSVAFDFSPTRDPSGVLRVSPNGPLGLFEGRATVAGTMRFPHPAGVAPHPDFEFTLRADRMNLDAALAGLSGVRGSGQGTLSLVGFARGPLRRESFKEDVEAVARLDIAGSTLLRIPYFDFLTSTLGLSALIGTEATEASGTIVVDDGVAWTSNLKVVHPIAGLLFKARTELDHGGLEGRVFVRMRRGTAARTGMVSKAIGVVVDLVGTAVDDMTDQLLSLRLSGSLRAPSTLPGHLRNLMFTVGEIFGQADELPSSTNDVTQIPVRVPPALSDVSFAVDETF